MNDIPIEWIDALSESAVQYAAENWGVSKQDAHTRIETDVKNEALSVYLPKEEFKEYVQLWKIDWEPSSKPNFKTLFEYHIKRLGLSEQAEKILAVHKGDYRKAAE